FILHKDCALFDRRASKLATSIATTFTAEYVLSWPEHFPNMPLSRPYPTFDGRCVTYPTAEHIRDYLSWRQTDCHINNLFNTTFWTMVQQGGMGATDAEQELKGTVSSDKNEILYSRFGINYNNEPEMYRKGSVVFRQLGTPVMAKPRQNGMNAGEEGASTHADTRQEVVDESSHSDHSSFLIGSVEPEVEVRINDAPVIVPPQLIEIDSPQPLGTRFAGEVTHRNLPIQPPGTDPAAAASLQSLHQKTKAENQGRSMLRQASDVPVSKTQMAKEKKRRRKAEIVIEHVDVIGDTFWGEHTWILAERTARSGLRRAASRPHS
ncbi:tRNA-His guanylyltransferase, partial [Elasticomyces elasticus]